MTVLRGSQKSIILISRQYGIHVGPNDIPEKFQIENRELTSEEMCQLANAFDLKAKSVQVKAEELTELLKKKTTNIKA